MARPCAAANTIPPRVAVVDGTHLCLLPRSTSISPPSGNSHDVPPKKKKTEDDDAPDDAKGTPDDDDPPPFLVPAVPLRSVPLFLSKRFRPLSSLAAEDSSTSDRNPDGEKGGVIADDNDDEHDEEEPPGAAEVIRLPLHLSGPLAVCHSVERPLAIGAVLAQTNMDGGILVSARPAGGDGSSRKEDDDDDDDEHDDGGQSAGTVRLIDPPEKRGRGCGGGTRRGGQYGGRTSLEADNGGAGCVVADFCGLGGFDQVLLLPPLSVGVAAAPKAGAGKDGATRNEEEALLRTVLRRSVLTDGAGALLPWRGRGVEIVGLSTERGGSIGALGRKRRRYPKIRLRAIESLDDGMLDEPKKGKDGKKKRRRRRRDGRKGGEEDGAKKKQRTEVSEEGNDEAKRPAASAERKGSEPTDDGETGGGGGDGKKKKGRWAAVLEAGIRSRLAREDRLRSEADAARDERAYLAKRSRRALEAYIAATSPPPASASKVSPSSSSGGTVSSAAVGSDAAVAGGEAGVMEVPRLQMLRMRYGVRPGGAGSASIDGNTNDGVGGMSILIHVEVDVLLCDGGVGVKSSCMAKSAAANDDGRGDKRGDNPGDDPSALLELHLAFAPAPCPCADTLSVSTRSGVVPALRRGECVTVVTLVEVSGIRTPFVNLNHQQSGNEADNTDPAAVALAVNAHWKTRIAGRDDSQRVENPRRRLRAGGAALGAVRLPLESIVLSGAAGGGRGDGEEADRLIDFSAPSSRWPPDIPVPGRTPRRDTEALDDGGVDDDDYSRSIPAAEPTIVYDYRNPRVLEIDASRSADGTVGEWESLVASINAHASFGNRVDIDRGRWGGDDDAVKQKDESGSGGDDGGNEGGGGGMRLRLVVLGRTPEERLALVRLVLKHMPESARVLDPDEMTGGAFPGEESRAARDLCVRMRDEVDALNRHRKMREEDFTTETLRETAELQRRTDEAASRIRRGWEDDDDRSAAK